MSNETFKIRNGLTLTPVDLTTLVNPQAGDLACDINDSNKIKRYDATSLSWKEVGAGGADDVNALLIQTFDQASLADFTQTGLALITSNTLNGDQSARLIHQSGSPQSFKQTISVDRKFRSQAMQLSLSLQSTAPHGDVTINIYDETNAANIVASEQLTTGSQAISGLSTTNASAVISGFTNAVINTLKVGERVTGSGIPTGSIINSINTTALTVTISQNATATASGLTLNFSELPTRQVVGFTIPASCSSLSYTVTALAEAGSPETYVDDVVIELAETALLETSVEVPVVTAWQGYTPTFQGFGTPTNVEFEWRQVGENVEIRGKFTAGTPTSVEARIGLPGGLTSAGTAVIPSLQVAGISSTNYSSTLYFSNTALIEPSVTYFTLGVQASTFGSLNKATGTGVAATGTQVSVSVTVPCAGLSATNTTTIPLTQAGLIQEEDFKFAAAGNAGQAITNAVTNIPFTFSSMQGDLGTWDGSKFTFSRAAQASFSFSVSFTTSGLRAIDVYRNGTLLYRPTDSPTASQFSGSFTDYFAAGDEISLRTAGSGGTLNNATDIHWLRIVSQGSLKQVNVITNQKATIPTSELRFEGASSRGAVATAIVRFDTQAKLRGDAFSVVSDANNGTAITMLKAGKLDISTTLYSNLDDRTIWITKNQAILTTIPTASESLSSNGLYTGTTGGPVLFASYSGFVSVGDVIRVAMNGVPTADAVNNLNLSFQEQSVQVSVSNVLPQFSESDSSVRLSGANGYGSTATTTRRFSSVVQNIGSDIEYVDSTTLGGQFIAKSAGIYNVTYGEQTTLNVSTLDLYISVNGAVVSSQRDSRDTASTATKFCNASWSGYLNSGDIVTVSTVNANGNATYFTISKVGKPNVTGVDVTPFVNLAFDKGSIGEIKAFAGNVDANHFLACDGSAVSRSGYSELFRAIGTTYGVGDGSSTFNLPDFRGVFLRGLDSGRGLDTGRVLGSYQDDAFQGHKHSSTTGNNSTAGGNYTIGSASFGTTNNLVGNPVTDGVNGTPRTASETRPKNVAVNYGIRWKATNEAILTPTETFSTDTASLQYASSAQYTLSTLANAPVGTYITFTVASGGNIATQTTTRPTQTDADMNANGILIYSRAYNVNSTAALPAKVAIQIGKGMKGISRAGYVSTGKINATTLDHVMYTSVIEWGTDIVYNELTGILTIDASTCFSTGTTTRYAGYSIESAGAQNNAYITINASKNPALTGLGLNTVQARARQTSGQSIAAAGTETTMIYDTAETFDTGGALNPATGVFTCPESGYYQVNGAFLSAILAWAVGNYYQISIFKNGVRYSANYQVIEAAVTQYKGATISDVMYLAKGDTVYLSLSISRSAGATTLDVTGNYNYISISKTSIGTGN